jgi:hypothetical protein
VIAPGRSRALLVPLLAAAFIAGACGSAPSRASEPGARRGKPVEFLYGTPSGETLSSANTRGRVTVLLFVTTFDLPSQLMAKRLDVVARRHRPRVNAGAIALEPPNDAPLVEVFRSSLGLGYPVGLTNGTLLDEKGPFGTIDQVPVLVVLDSRGVEVARAEGVVSEAELDAALTRAAR